MFPGPYYSYPDGNQPYNSEYNYNGYADNYFVRDYSGYGYGYADYPPQNFHPPRPPIPMRPRSPTPPPPPAHPSPEYLAASLSPQPASVPASQRKLVIFDLNGTLLLRSPRSYGTQRKIYPRPYARALVLFLAHPAVRAWLDAMVWSSAQPHNVREMVERVFGAGEGEGKGPILRAVWARDTLGLGREAFHQKTQTTKDLAKPWAFFAAPPKNDAYSPTAAHGDEPLASGCVSSTPERASSPPLPPPSSAPSSSSWSAPGLSSSSSSSWSAPGLSSLSPSWPADSTGSGWGPADTSSSSAQPPSASCQPSAIASEQPLDMSATSATSDTAVDEPAPALAPAPHPHGPETTLLVDDSPLKARLQPWNHLCVGEYDASVRRADLTYAALALQAQTPATDAGAVGGDGEEGAILSMTNGGASPNGNADSKRRTTGLDAELAALAEEAAAAAEAEASTSGAGAGANGVVKKERWRKRRRREQQEEQEGAAQSSEVQARSNADASGVGESADMGEGGEQTRTQTYTPTPKGTRPGQSKRSRRRARLRAAAGDAVADDANPNPNPNGAGDEGGDADVADTDERAASGSGTSPSVSPTLPPAGVAAADADRDADGGAAQTGPPLSNRKRKREGTRFDEAAPAPAHTHTQITDNSNPSPDPNPDPMPPADSNPKIDAAGTGTDGEPYDPTLLAVVGVLAHVRGVGNVAAWVRGGGLVGVVGGDGPMTTATTTGDADATDVDVEGGAEGGAAPALATENGAADGDPSTWFASRGVLVAWAARGRAALGELGIEAVVGVGGGAD